MGTREYEQQQEQRIEQKTIIYEGTRVVVVCRNILTPLLGLNDYVVIFPQQTIYGFLDSNCFFPLDISESENFYLFHLISELDNT